MRTKIVASIAVFALLAACNHADSASCEWSTSAKQQAALQVPRLISEDAVLSNWGFEPVEPELYDFSSGHRKCSVSVRERSRDSLFAIIDYNPDSREFGEIKNVEILE
jgi:hypothetical protein